MENSRYNNSIPGLLHSGKIMEGTLSLADESSRCFLVVPKAGVALQRGFSGNSSGKSFCIAYSRFNTKFFIVSPIKIGDCNGYSQMDSGIYSSPRRSNEQGGWYHHAERTAYPVGLAAGSGFFNFSAIAGEAPSGCLTLCRRKPLLKSVQRTDCCLD